MKLEQIKKIRKEIKDITTEYEAKLEPLRNTLYKAYMTELEAFVVEQGFSKDWVFDEYHDPSCGDVEDILVF